MCVRVVPSTLHLSAPVPDSLNSKGIHIVILVFYQERIKRKEEERETAATLFEV